MYLLWLHYTFILTSLVFIVALSDKQYTFTMIDTELEILYSPSKWSKRDQVIQRHVNFGIAGN